MTPSLRLVPNEGHRPAGVGAAPWPDVALAAFLFVTHAVLVVAFAAGWSPGEGAAGYATAVALLAGRELVLELRPRLRRGAGSSHAGVDG